MVGVLRVPARDDDGRNPAPVVNLVDYGFHYEKRSAYFPDVQRGGRRGNKEEQNATVELTKARRSSEGAASELQEAAGGGG